MNKATDAVFYCSHSKKGIVSDERMCSINVHWETFSNGCITVHKATSHFVFCSTCATQRDFDGMAIPLMSGQNSA